MNFTKEQKRTAYQKLSDSEKEFIGSYENIETIEVLARQYELEKSIGDLLDTEVYNSMIGLQTIDQMTSTLEKELKLPSTRILELVVDLKSKIFNKLDSLRTVSTDANGPITTTQAKKFQQTIPQSQGVVPAKLEQTPSKPKQPPRPDWSILEVNQGGKGLIEDARGNADNLVREAQNVKPETSDNTVIKNEELKTQNTTKLTLQTLYTKPTPEYTITEGEPNILKEQLVPPNLPTGKETPFEKKIAEQAGTTNNIIKKVPPIVLDPYRESL